MTFTESSQATWGWGKERGAGMRGTLGSTGFALEREQVRLVTARDIHRKAIQNSRSTGPLECGRRLGPSELVGTGGLLKELSRVLNGLP